MVRASDYKIEREYNLRKNRNKNIDQVRRDVLEGIEYTPKKVHRERTMEDKRKSAVLPGTNIPLYVNNEISDDNMNITVENLPPMLNPNQGLINEEDGARSLPQNSTSNPLYKCSGAIPKVRSTNVINNAINRNEVKDIVLEVVDAVHKESMKNLTDSMSNMLKDILANNNNSYANRQKGNRRFRGSYSNWNEAPNNHQYDANDDQFNNIMARVRETLSQEQSNLNTSANSGQIRNEKVQLDKWGISFDGKNMSIEDFLFRVDCKLANSTYTAEQVYNHFNNLLRGSAENWYWRFRRSNVNSDYATLKLTMLEHFRSCDNDVQIWAKLIGRHQKPGEKFDSFVEDMEELFYRMTSRPPINDLITVMRENVNYEISLAIGLNKTNSLINFKQWCREAEKLVNKNKTSAPKKRFIEEVNAREYERHDEIDGEANLEALRTNFVKRDTSNFTCFNCDLKGHGFYDCPLETRNLFCYRCGEKNVTCVRCPKCSGKIHSSE